MSVLPALLQFENGAPVLDAQDWQARRSEIIALLGEHIYGFSPAVYGPTSKRVLGRDANCCAGHAELYQLEISAATPKGAYAFPIHFFAPTAPGRYPTIVLINFEGDAYSRYCPAEEILDQGFALAIVHYNDITRDNADWDDGLAAHFERPEGSGFGKLGLWAWAASRIADVLLTCEQVDGHNLAVAGHSRLGKAALWCGAQDERFRFVIANDSGCAGAAIERCKRPGSETAEGLAEKMPFWFCQNYQKWSKQPDRMPFDQHFVLAAIAPRYACVGSASLDFWADQYAEQRCCTEASAAWTVCGQPGYLGPSTPAKAGDAFLTGSIGYQMRDGKHFLSRNDWNRYLAFMLAHLDRA